MMVRAMSIEELEGLIRRKYHISKLARLERVEVIEYLAVFKFSNGKSCWSHSMGLIRKRSCLFLRMSL